MHQCSRKQSNSAPVTMLYR